MEGLRGSLGDLGNSRGPLGSLGGPWVKSSEALWGALGPPLGDPWDPLGDPWGALRAPLGGQVGPGGILETKWCGEAALQKQWFYNMNGYIWALGGSLGKTSS